MWVSSRRRSSENTAVAHHEQHLGIAREPGDPYGEIIALNGLACACIGLQEYRRAVEYYNSCLQIAQRIGQTHEEGEARWGLSKLLDNLGHRPQAIKHAEAEIGRASCRERV